MFCEFCGKMLKDNELCSCPQAQAKAAAAGLIPTQEMPYTPPQTENEQPKQEQAKAEGTSGDPLDDVIAKAGETAGKAAEKAGEAAGKAAAAVADKLTDKDGKPNGALLKKLIPAAAAVLALIVLAAVGIANRKTTVNMKKYIAVTYNGMNTKGSAEVSTDYMTLDNDALGDSKSFLSDAILLEAGIDVDAAPTEGLSNGDTVTVTVTYDESTAKRLKLKFTNTELDFTVSGLPDGTETDVFADLDVTFEGIAPNGTAILNNRSDNDFVKGVSFEVEPSNGLKNGDTVTITARYSESAAENQLVVVPEDTKTYTVSGLDEYVTSYDQLGEDILAEADSQARSVIDTNLRGNRWNYADTVHSETPYYEIEEESISLGDISLLTTYFASVKDGANERYMNKLILVYEVTASDNTTDSVTGYYAVGFHDFIRQGDGSISVNLVDNCDEYGNPSTDAVYNEVISPLSATYSVSQS